MQSCKPSRHAVVACRPRTLQQGAHARKHRARLGARTAIPARGQRARQDLDAEEAVQPDIARLARQRRAERLALSSIHVLGDFGELAPRTFPSVGRKAPAGRPAGAGRRSRHARLRHAAHSVCCAAGAFGRRGALTSISSNSGPCTKLFMQCTAHRPPICFSWYMPIKSLDSFSPSTGPAIAPAPAPAPAPLASSSRLRSESEWIGIPPRRRSVGAPEPRALPRISKHAAPATAMRRTQPAAVVPRQSASWHRPAIKRFSMHRFSRRCSLLTLLRKEEQANDRWQGRGAAEGARGRCGRRWPRCSWRALR